MEFVASRRAPGTLWVCEWMALSLAVAEIRPGQKPMKSAVHIVRYLVSSPRHLEVPMWVTIKESEKSFSKGSPVEEPHDIDGFE